MASVLVNQLVVDVVLRCFVVAVGDSRCVTSVPHGVGAEQRGQNTADSGISVAHEGQAGMGLRVSVPRCTPAATRGSSPPDRAAERPPGRRNWLARASSKNPSSGAPGAG